MIFVGLLSFVGVVIVHPENVLVYQPCGLVYKTRSLCRSYLVPLCPLTPLTPLTPLGRFFAF